MNKKPVVFLKSHVEAFTRKDGAVVAAHDTKVTAATRPAPGVGEIGHHEHSTYGVHFQPGDYAKDSAGNTHKVLSHSGAGVLTESGGTYHPTKLKPVPAPAGNPGAPTDAEVEAQRRGSAPIQQKGAPPVEGVKQKSPAEKVAAKRKELAGRKLDAHPNVIGKAEKGDKRSMHFDGKQYHATGKTGHSFHDQTPVAEYEHPESGHRVWRDGQDRVHADSHEEAKKHRGG